MKDLQIDRLDSPIGAILLVVDGERLCSLDFADCEEHMITSLRKRYGPIQLTSTRDPRGFSSRIRDYFTGDYNCLETIPVSTGGTVFQQQVWLALRSIPPGTTMTYGGLAAKLGNPTAYRAVGRSNALNPVAIVLPCHRVIGADASLTGYAGGLERKQWLLRHEGYTLEKKHLDVVSLEFSPIVAGVFATHSEGQWRLIRTFADAYYRGVLASGSDFARKSCKTGRERQKQGNRVYPALPELPARAVLSKRG